MKRVVFIYLALFLAVIFQVQIGARSAWIPDIILLLVVFESIFRTGKEAVIFAFIAGLIRGSLSYGTFLADIFIFPVIGALGFLEGRIFYRYNPLAQILITALSACLVVFAHSVFLTASGAETAAFPGIFIHNWRTLTATIVSAPILFFIMTKSLKLEE